MAYVHLLQRHARLTLMNYSFHLMFMFVFAGKIKTQNILFLYSCGTHHSSFLVYVNINFFHRGSKAGIFFSMMYTKWNEILNLLKMELNFIEFIFWKDINLGFIEPQSHSIISPPFSYHLLNIYQNTQEKGWNEKFSFKYSIYFLFIYVRSKILIIIKLNDIIYSWIIFVCGYDWLLFWLYSGLNWINFRNVLLIFERSLKYFWF